MTTTLNASTAGAGGFIATSDNSGILALQTAGTTAITVDTSQNVGIGRTPSSKLDVGGAIRTTLLSDTTYYGTFNNSNGAVQVYANGDSAPLLFGTTSVGGSTATERMRIDPSGNLLVGGTTAGAKVRIETNLVAQDGLDIKNTSATTGQTFVAFFNSANGVAGTITQPTSTTVLYNTTSDYRLKTVTGAVTGQGARIDALKPVDYLWTDGGQQARGFLAHEFQEVYANSVTGTKDAVGTDGNPKYQAMQASSSEVIADLVAEIQSLRQRFVALETKSDTQAETINALTARIVALEGK
jgi:hypothetical protein